MKNKRIIHRIGILLLGCLAFFIQGCKDPVITENTLTNNPEDFLNSGREDTFTIHAFTTQETALPSYAAAQSLCGSMNDPAFGKTWCGVYAQVLLPELNIRFPGAVIDSVVLSMPYLGRYGKCTLPQDLVVYELAQPIDANSTSYTNRDAFQIISSPLGLRYGFVPNFSDSVKVRGQNKAPQLRVTLSKNFGTKLLGGDSLTYSDNQRFLNYIKGFYLATNTSLIGDGVMILNSFASKIIAYYHTATVADTLVEFPITNSAQVINHIDHDYNGTPAQAAFQSTSASGEKRMYIQAGAGTRGKILLPTLKKENLGNIAINKAELIMPLAEDPSGLDSLYIPPPWLILQYLDANGQGYDIPSSIDNKGVGLLKSKVENGATKYYYSFILTNTLQKIINGDLNNYGFSVGYSFAQRVNRVVIEHGFTHPDNRIKLQLTYTKL